MNTNGLLIAILIIVLCAAQDQAVLSVLPVPPLPQVMPRLNPYGGDWWGA